MLFKSFIPFFNEISLSKQNSPRWETQKAILDFISHNGILKPYYAYINKALSIENIVKVTYFIWKKKATYEFLIYNFPLDIVLTGAEFVGIFYLLAYCKIKNENDIKIAAS